MKLKDKVAVITGGTEGIGKEIALGYIREGAKVAVAARSADKLENMRQEMGDNGIAIKTDVGQRDDVDAMVEAVVNEFGRLDILVNNAAIYPAAPFMEIKEDDWLEVINVNLNGIYRCTQAAAGIMLQQGSGRIINVASAQGLVGVPMMSHYTATKGGMIALTRVLAAELSPAGININTVAPGLTATENLSKELPPPVLDALAKMCPLGRPGRPEEYVGICVMLASDDGSYITGETIAADGGLSQVLTLPPMG